MQPTENIRPGDANRITREYFDSFLIEMRHLDGVLPSTQLTLYGHTFDTPVAMAAFSHLDKFRYHPNGMAEIAAAAASANALNFAGMGSEEELERILGTGAKTVKIIKPYADNDRILRKIAHAERVGALAVGMDIDHSFNHRGEYDDIGGEAMRPKSLEELKMFVRATRLPFVVKGVLSAVDARKCAEAGVQGIVVSHHHGILDYATPPLIVLPKIVAAVEGSMPIFVDCGVETGCDAFKALALGASAVCVGRAILEPLREGGAAGARKKLDKMREELAGAMARTGAQDIRGIDPNLLWRR